jgi:hypothetical protein
LEEVPFDRLRDQRKSVKPVKSVKWVKPEEV